MVPVVCPNCRHVFDAPEDRLRLTCSKCGFRMTKKEPSITVAQLMTGPLLATIRAGVPALPAKDEPAAKDRPACDKPPAAPDLDKAGG